MILAGKSPLRCPRRGKKPFPARDQALKEEPGLQTLPNYFVLTSNSMVMLSLIILSPRADNDLNWAEL